MLAWTHFLPKYSSIYFAGILLKLISLYYLVGILSICPLYIEFGLVSISLLSSKISVYLLPSPRYDFANPHKVSPFTAI
jgi:hypothetical protein